MTSFNNIFHSVFIIIIIFFHLVVQIFCHKKVTWGATFNVMVYIN